MENLNKLFAGLVFHRHNVHMLHWKSAGTDFDSVHKLMDDYVSKFNDFIDEVAEMILSMGGDPLTLIECVDFINNDDTSYMVIDPNEDHTPDQIFDAISIIFIQLYEMYADVCDNDHTPSECVSKLDDHRYWLRIEYSYKNKKRNYR